MAIQDEIPKSRITLTYKTEVDGELEDVDLPMRFLAMGDLSLGTSSDRKTDLDERRLRSAVGSLSQVMTDMNISLGCEVANKIDPENQKSLQVNIPIVGMHSFSPDNFSMHVPRIKGLIVLRRLLEQVQSDISNKKRFRNLLSDLYANEDAFTNLLGELKGFESLRLPQGGKPEPVVEAPVVEEPIVEAPVIEAPVVEEPVVEEPVVEEPVVEAPVVEAPVVEEPVVEEPVVEEPKPTKKSKKAQRKKKGSKRSKKAKDKGKESEDEG
jgi:type VI secretion system protein ImpB